MRRDSVAWQKYEANRSDQLEAAAAGLWEKAIPAATVDRNLRYETQDGANGELDIMCRVDRTLVLCECKAGSLKFPTKQSRMLRSLKRILGKAHEQGIRAREHIQLGSGEFRRPDGETICIDASDYDRVILCVVTLDDATAFTTTMAHAVSAGVFAARDLPWVVSVTDLEIIADIAEFNLTVPHYLLRRARIAPLEKFSAIEELDWFMHYLEDGLWFADDLEQARGVNLMSFTQGLDEYYMYQFGERQKPAPRPKWYVKKAYKEVLGTVESSRRSGWLEAALMLANVDTPTQDLVLKYLRELRRKPYPTGRVLVVDDYIIAIYSERAKPGLLGLAMREYVKARMVTRGLRRAVVIGIDPTIPGVQPLVGYVDDRFDEMPSTSAAAKYLSRFDSKELAGI